MSASEHRAATPSQSLAYFLAIDGPLFRTQREALGKLIALAGQQSWNHCLEFRICSTQSQTKPTTGMGLIASSLKPLLRRQPGSVP